VGDRSPLFADYPEFAEKFVELFNSDAIRKSELCSAGAQCNARGLAKLAAIMANRGQALEKNTKSLMSESTWKEMHSEPTFAYDGAFPGTKG
jgi:hypothetical protein